MSDRLEAQLLSLLGEEGYIRLLEAHGGVLTYVPHRVDRTKLADEIGLDHARALSEEYGGDYLQVPVSRAFRAHFYRRAGMTLKQIARRLTMSESGVYRLFREAKKRGHSERQFSLFE